MLEKYNVDNKRELAEVYRQFEIMPRSTRDMLKVEADALGLNWPLWLSELVVSVAAMEYFNHKRLKSSGSLSTQSNDSKVLTKEDRVELLKGYLKEGRFLSSIFIKDEDKSIPQHLKKSAVAFIMIKSWRKDAIDSKKFWTDVGDGERLTRDMPQLLLREFLMKNKNNNRRYITTPISNHEYGYRCAQAWNAFRKNRKTKLAYFPDKNIPDLV